MLPGLFDAQRRALARLATMLVAGALCVLPLTTQGSSIAGASDAAPSVREENLVEPSRLTFPAYTIDRDPFVPMDPRVDAVDQDPEPSNGAAAEAPLLRAVIVGDPPRALIELGGVVHVTGAGDRIGKLTVVGIDADGVTLSDGSRLLIPGNH